MTWKPANEPPEVISIIPGFNSSRPVLTVDASGFIRHAVYLHLAGAGHWQSFIDSERLSGEDAPTLWHEVPPLPDGPREESGTD